MSTKKAASMYVCLIFLLWLTSEAKSAALMASAPAVDPVLRTDVNGDGVVDILDIGAVANAWNSYPGSQRWDSKLDLNNDEVINLLDMVLVAMDLRLEWVSYDFDKPLDWNAESGTWEEANGSLDGSSAGEGLIHVRDDVWKDCVLIAKVKIAVDSPRTEVAVCFHLIDSGSFYWAGLGSWGHRVSISRKASNVPQELAFNGDQAGIDRDVWYVLTVKVSGSVLMLYVNDSLELSVNDSTFARGSVGIRTWNSHVIIDYITIIGTRAPQGVSIDRSIGSIPDNWRNDHWGGVGFFKNNFFDYNVVRTPGIPSIRLEPDLGDNVFRETECRRYPCKPGDHIIAKVWIKIDPLPAGWPASPKWQLLGARIGMDLYGGDQCVGVTYGTMDIDPNQPTRNVYGYELEGYVFWGTPGWTQKTIDIIIPSGTFDYNPNLKTTVSPRQIDSFWLWLNVMRPKEPANAWFTDAELYINP